MKYIYIAGPYTNGDPVLNVRKAIEAADELRELGYVPFIPHLCHLWHLISPHEYEYWMLYCFEWLERCDGLLRLPGESEGADREVDRMLILGKPVFYVLPLMSRKEDVK